MKEILSNKIVKFIIMLIIIATACSLITYSFGINKIIFVLTFIAIIVDYIFVFKNDLFEKIVDNFVRYRFLICFILFLICVLFKISCSSIGIYDQAFPTKLEEKNSILFGNVRSIRSDEWVVMTPYYFSQKYNSFDKISYQMSIEGQNMIIGYNSPVKDITILGKPLVWGYMLLGNEYGLSWYWCMKLILIFLASFEMCYIITKKNKKLSLVGGLLVTYGPSTQWWFAPHMPDVIIWSMVLFSFIYHLCSHKKESIRNILTILTPFVALEFVVALFPSFQVGLGYFILSVFLAVIFRDKIKLFENKKQIARLAIVSIASLGLIGYFVISNKDALKYEMNTAYPGKRIDLGGNNQVKDLFTDLATPFLAYTGQKSPYNNQSEDSTYIHFGMFILFLSPLLIKELKKKKDKDFIVGIGIILILLIDMFFMIFGFPKFLSKITLFSYINRMKMIVGFISIIFTIWGFNALEKVKDNIDNKYYYLAIFSYCLLYLSFIDQSLINYLSRYLYYFEIILFAGILLFLKKKNSDYSYATIIALVIFSSIAINPIVRGASSITNHPSASEITKITKEDKESYWIGYNNLVYSSYLLANGAKTFNAVNFYPDFGKWKEIDKDGNLDDIYNRYAHIVTTISEDGENHVDYYLTPDALTLKISMKTMDKFNIKYVFTNEDLSNLKEDNYYLDEIYKDNDVRIYELLTF